MASQTNSISALLPEPNLEQLQQSVSGLTSGQLYWASGYLAGLAQASGDHPASLAPVSQAAAAHQSDPAVAVTLLYGSQTGNGRRVATAVNDQLVAKGVNVRLTSMLDYRNSDLKSESYLVIVLSTHGEGDPPDDAEDFYAFLMGKRAPKMPGLKYSVLALGDSSYARFCETGRLVDERLEALGASRLAPRIDCDVDYEESARAWTAQTVSILDELVTVPDSAVVTPLRAVRSARQYTRQHPLTAEVIDVQKITGRHSSKDVQHIEIDITGASLTYEAGDSLGVIVHNQDDLVTRLIELTGVDPEFTVTMAQASMSVRDALTQSLEITRLSRKFMENYSQLSQQSALTEILEDNNRDKLMQLMDSYQIYDVIKHFPAPEKFNAQQLVELLRPLAPRSYSISSSPEVYPDEVHLTVAVVEYQAFGETHHGAASSYLGRTLKSGDKVQVYVEANPRFRLPQDPAKPVIMIGPGTGVAPFRAFLDQRDAQNATGDNWLVFGDRTFSNDFLYQVEWQRLLKSGRLTRLDVAFSRDQSSKVYVQDRLREHGEELYRWLENGAYVYVCGDARQMAPDVQAALIEVISRQGSLNADGAGEYLQTMRREGRYLRDVY